MKLQGLWPVERHGLFALGFIVEFQAGYKASYASGYYCVSLRCVVPIANCSIAMP